MVVKDKNDKVRFECDDNVIIILILFTCLTLILIF